MRIIKNIEILGLSDLRNSQINWSDFNFERPEELTIKSLKNYVLSKTALENAINHFEKNGVSINNGTRNW